MKPRVVVMLSVCLFGVMLGTSARSQVTTFTKWFGGPKYDAGFCAQQLRGGGFILVGTSLTLTNAYNDVLVVRVGCTGDTIWTRTIGGRGNDEGLSVCQTFDGGFAIAGTKSTLPPDTVSVYIIKLDSVGTLSWTKKLRHSVTDYANAICETRDSGLAIAGVMGSGPRGRSDGWLIKMDRLGDTLWTKTYGGAGDDGLRSILLLPDDGFLLCGYSNTFGAGSLDHYVIRTNAGGDTIWTRAYGGPDNETAWSVDAVNDSGFIIGGVVTHGAPTNQTSMFALVRIGENGDTLWTKVVDSAVNESSVSVRHTRDGGFAFVGTTFITDRQDDALLVKTDRWGELQWRRSFGGVIDDNAWSLQQCEDGGYIIAGMVCENTYDAYLVKTDELGLLSDIDDVNPTSVPPSFHLVQNYPNPFNPSTTITYLLRTQGHIMLKVFDLLGRDVTTLVNEQKMPGQHQILWNASGMASGVYIVQMRSGSFAETKKVIIIQ